VPYGRCQGLSGSPGDRRAVGDAVVARPSWSSIWAQDACHWLRDTLDLTRRTLMPDLPVCPWVRHGQPGQILGNAACYPSDLLVVGLAAWRPGPDRRQPGEAHMPGPRRVPGRGLPNRSARAGNAS
jgi:hypothetical protein